MILVNYNDLSCGRISHILALISDVTEDPFSVYEILRKIAQRGRQN